MLKNAIHPLDEKRAVKVTAEQHHAHTGVSLTYEQYSTLRLSAATTYNQQFETERTPIKRQVLLHDNVPSKPSQDVLEYQDITDKNDSDVCGIDSPVCMIEANIHERVPPNNDFTMANTTQLDSTRLPHDCWVLLP